MNDEKDPIYSFFPDDEEPDLYAALGVTDKATVDEIKKAYRKLALQYHPDKVGASEENTQKFHQIGFAYTVLNDEKRRKKYDNTGRTDESMFDGEADWNAYFKELWSGEVNGQTLDEFRMEYKGSDEERTHILEAYTNSEGSLDALFENVMCSNVLEDEERFIEIVQSAIKAGDLKSTPQWKKDVKDTKGRQKRKAAAESEAKEAEEMAKEMGIHDKLYGSKKGDKASSAKKGGKKGKVNEDGVDEDALKALIQSRNQKENRMGALIESLESRYGNGATETKGKKGANKRGAKAVEAEPTEEEFEAMQKKLFGGKKDSHVEAAPPAKKQKRAKKA